MKNLKMLFLTIGMTFWGIMPLCADHDVVMADALLALSTDKCQYAPGEEVVFNAVGSVPADARIRYRQGLTVVADEPLNGRISWTWTAPGNDFTGYMADVYVSGANGSETIHGAIAVDVSSSWSRFPRYGFVATYDDSKTSDVIKEEMSFLNRCHINGIQFYDWQYLHEIPLCGTAGNAAETWTDIANRTIRAQAVRDYISVQHGYGMKAMFYNLLYGAEPESESRGVCYEWGLFNDPAHNGRDKHDLPDGWKGPIYLCDPASSGWQQFLAEKNDDVYATFDFDGFHIDQLGSRGDVYGYEGSKVDLPEAYAKFIHHMKLHRPDKHLVMNGVSDYGGTEIIGTGDVDFSYTELWDGDDSFENVERLVRGHAAIGDGNTASVFAAYMNYNRKDYSNAAFNTPGVLLTDAVMYAVGGSRLELGDGHMLCAEYFPNGNLKMTDELKAALPVYYDFMTAYENLLRDEGTVTDPGISSADGSVSIGVWPPAKRQIVAYARQQRRRKVVSLLNFTGVADDKHLRCRDVDGDMPEPEQYENLSVRIQAENVSAVWTASPDRLGGTPQTLSFEQDGGYVTFEVPSLKYWTMVVIEQNSREPMVVGDAVWCGWEASNAAMTVRSETQPDVFTYTGWLEADKEFKFLTQCDYDGDEYRNANAADAYIDGEGKLQLNGSDYKFKVHESGNYTLTLNLEQMTIHVAKAGYQATPIYYNVLYMVGDNTPGGWSLDHATPLWQDKDRPFRFSTVVRLTEAGSFKLAVNPHGGWSQRFFFRDAADAEKVSDDNTDDRQWTVPADGDYAVTVDLSDNTIRIVPVGAVVRIGTTGYATYCCDRRLDFSAVDGVKAYIATGTYGKEEVQKLIVQRVDDVPALTGILLHGAAGEYVIPLSTGTNTYLNMFKGVTTDTYLQAEENGYRNFVLSDGSRGIGFYPAQDGVLPANRAYLPLPVAQVTGAKSLLFDITETTAIPRLDKGNVPEDVSYTLSGVRVSRPGKGVYIRNGKKVVVK